MNAIAKIVGAVAIGFAFLLPVQSAQASVLTDLEGKIQSFLAGVKSVDPVLYSKVEQDRKESINNFVAAVATAWKTYTKELAAREKEYLTLLKEYVLAQFSKERAKLVAIVNAKIAEVKAKINAALATYKVKLAAFESELAAKIQSLIDNLAKA